MSNKKKTKKCKKKAHYEKGECKGWIYRLGSWNCDSICVYFIRTGIRRYNYDNGKCACKKLKED